MSDVERSIDGVAETVSGALANQKYSIDYHQREYNWDSKQPTPRRHLPQIPARWRWMRLASCARQVRESGRTDLQLLSVYLGRGVIPYAEGGRRVHAPSDRLDSYQVVRPGDLVMNNQQAWRGSVGVSVYHGIISPAYLIWRLSSDISPKYASYLFPAPVMVDQFVMASRGVGDIQRDLHTPSLRNVLVPVPPREEQTAIVKYLRHANARIHRAIAARRRLIALLEEAALAIANDLIPDVAGSDAREVPWLGRVPGTWRVVPAKRLFRELDRRTSTGSEGLLSLRMREGLVDANRFAAVALPPSDLVGYKVVEPGDLVMNRMRAAIGLFGVTPIRGLVSPDYSTMRAIQGVDPEFYLLLFKTSAAMAEFRRRSTGLGTGSSGFMRLYFEEFGSVPLPLPPLHEQRQIVASVAEQRARLDPAIVRARQEIELLREFRARLTVDVVTGQLDVREVSKSLPSVDLAALEESTDIDDAMANDVIEMSEV